MIVDQMRLYAQGRDYWWYYVRLNGFAVEPTPKGLAKLSRDLDISINHLARCITLYLEA